MIEAVSFLHSKGIVHMDIKGDNIFINEKGDWLLGFIYYIFIYLLFIDYYVILNWQLGDFGSSKLIGQPITSTTESFYPENLFGIFIIIFVKHMFN